MISDYQTEYFCLFFKLLHFLMFLRLKGHIMEGDNHVFLTIKIVYMRNPIRLFGKQANKCESMNNPSCKALVNCRRKFARQLLIPSPGKPFG